MDDIFLTLDVLHKLNVCQKVQAGLSNHATRKRQITHPDFPLRRFVMCGLCNKPLTACWAKSGKYPYYYCVNKICEKYSVSIKKCDLENEFIRYISKIKPSEDFLPVFNRIFIKKYEEKEKDIKGDYFRQMDEINKLEKEESWTISSGKKGILPEHIVKKDIDEIEQKLTLAKMRLTDLHAEELDVNALLAFGQEFIELLNLPGLKLLLNIK